MLEQEKSHFTRVTLKMIAEKAGTSVGTVDRALHDRDGVKGERKRQILQVAESLGYRPNVVARALGRRQAVIIGVVCPEEPAEFYNAIFYGIAAAAEELQDFGVVVERIACKSQDPEVARERMEQMDPARYDGLAVCLAGSVNIDQINRFMAAGTPVITFNIDSPDSLRHFYIGNDSVQSGLMGGELLKLLLDGVGNVTVLGNFAGASPFIDRLEGFSEYVRRNAPGLHVCPSAECHSDPDLAAQSLMDILIKVPDIRGVFCTGYSSTVGAVQALTALNRRDVKIIGHDVTATTAAALRDGWCHALLYQDPYQQGYQAVRLLHRHILEGWLPVESRLHVDTQIVLSCNVDRYLSQRQAKFEI